MLNEGFFGGGDGGPVRVGVRTSGVNWSVCPADLAAHIVVHSPFSAWDLSLQMYPQMVPRARQCRSWVAVWEPIRQKE